MITREGCRARSERLLSRLPEGCTGAVVASPEAIAYLTGFAPSPFTFRTAHVRSLALVVPGEVTLFVDDVLAPLAQRSHADRVATVAWYDGTYAAGLRGEGFAEAVTAELPSERTQRLGIEALAVPAGIAEAIERALPRVELVPIDVLLLRQRRTKDPDEVETLRAAVRAAEAGHAAAREGLTPGMTELELFHIVEQACRVAAGGPVLVYGDFAAGARARGPITLPTTRALAPGELLVLDFSVVIDGYRCDFANTLAVGAPTDGQRALFAACREALETGESLLRPGVPARQVDAAVRAVYARHGLDPAHAAHTGHGLGLAHPEAPFLVAGSDEVLEPGDVVTLEPSQNPPGRESLRIEHNYLITDPGHERLTHHHIGLQ
jgi:Xaa-Pro aminopeptidase